MRLAKADPEIARILQAEAEREAEALQMIASENYTSPAVLEAQGSVFTNKYAEGYPRARYYQGCGPSDDLEQLAIDRLVRLFGAEHANVQAHSGSGANMAAYMSLLQPGDKILGMDLAAGGHLTHGAAFNFSGKMYESHSYKVDSKSHRLDYGQIREQALALKPRLIVAGASAYPRTLDFKLFRGICDEVGAYLMVDMAHIAGLIAGGVHPSPLPYADIVTSTTHKTLRGPRGGVILCRQALAKKVDATIFPGLQGGPLVHVIAAKAVAFGEALRPEFAVYARQVAANAQALAQALLAKGYDLLTGGTENHLLLIDLRNRELNGAEAAGCLERAGIVANKNGIPDDPLGPRVTSGLRLGTPALTTRGMKEGEMAKIAEWIDQALQKKRSEDALEKIRLEVREFCRSYPVFQA